jgi:acyl carrier protein
MNSIEDNLREILVEDLFIQLDKAEIHSTDSLRHIGVDSLGFVELKAEVERRFSILIPEGDFTPENFSTLASLASLIERRCGAGSLARQ